MNVFELLRLPKIKDDPGGKKTRATKACEDFQFPMVEVPWEKTLTELVAQDPQIESWRRPVLPRAPQGTALLQHWLRVMQLTCECVGYKAKIAESPIVALALHQALRKRHCLNLANGAASPEVHCTAVVETLTAEIKMAGGGVSELPPQSCPNSP